MSESQVEAEASCVAAKPELAEWWIRYTKAWCKADGLTADECAPDPK